MTETDKYQLMPPLSEEEYAALKSDIRLRGVLVPVEYDDRGYTLDGHHRLRIVNELAAEGVRVDYPSMIRPGLSEEGKRTHVRALNLLRRHLTRDQRHTLIADQLKETPDKSDRQIAAILGTNRMTVGTVRKQLEKTGDVSLTDTRVNSLGRNQPAGKPARPGSASVILQSSREIPRALAGLSGMPEGSLPTHAITVKRLERIRRESDSAGRAEGIEERSIIGNADIRLGDFRTVLADIPDGSVDLILTDPPWGKDFLAVWDDLGEFGARILRPGGLLVTYVGQSCLPIAMTSLIKHLEYIWTVAQIGKGDKTLNYQLKIYAGWKPILVFSKPPFVPHKWVDDVLRGNGPEKQLHAWAQGVSESVSLIEAFTEPGAVVVDPFLGSGTTAVATVGLGRRFIGCDIVSGCAATSRERVAASRNQVALLES